MSLLATIITGGFSLIFLTVGFIFWKKYRFVQDTTVEKARSVAVGRTAVYGEAHELDRKLNRPFSAGKCLGYHYIIEERRDGQNGSEWSPVDAGANGIKFKIDDGTGEVCIDGNEADTTTYTIENDENINRTVVDRSEETPDEIVDFLESNSIYDEEDSDGLTGLLTNKKRRYTEKIISEGDMVYALGQSEPRNNIKDDESYDREHILKRDESNDRFIISSMSPEEIVEHYKEDAPIWIFMGLLFLVVTILVQIT